MTNQGFIKIPRSFLNWRWYNNRNTRLVFLDLMMRAAWCDEEQLGVKLHRGQVAISVPNLATCNQLTVQQIKTVLHNLKSTGDITTAANSKLTIITLNFYDNFQGINPQDNLQTTCTSTQNQPAPSSKNNLPTYLNNKKEIKEERITPAARVGRKNNYNSSNHSFDIDDIMAKIDRRG